MTKSSAIVIVSVVLLWFGLHPARASAASLYFSPSQKSVVTGGRVTVTLKVNAQGQAINAAEGSIRFSNSLLRLVSISKSGSIFTFWPVEPYGSTTAGTVSFSGGLPNPGYAGSSGTLVSLSFEALSSGTAELSISGAKVLANDGQGTNVLTTYGSASLTIGAASAPPPTPPTDSPRPAPIVSSTTFPDQSTWYTSEQGNVSWTKPSGVTGFSFHLSQDLNDVVDETVDTTSTTTSIDVLTDGVWYFAVRAKSASGWSAPSRFRIQRDHTPPADFTIQIQRDRGVTDPSPHVVFTATDETSGIDHYTLSLDGGTATEVSSPANLANLTAGHHHVMVIAFDRAGNQTTSQTTFDQVGYPAPIITNLTSPLLLLDRLIVKGTATAGDTVTVFIDNQPIGQAIAGQVDTSAQAEGVTVRAPWILTTDHIFRPGHYQVTAQAAGVNGELSVMTDPSPLLVSGHSIWLSGQPIATIALAPVAAIGFVVLVGLITLSMAQLLWTVRRMHLREVTVERELEDLRRRVKRGQTTSVGLDESLEDIERDLVRPRRSTVRRPRRTGRRRS